MIKLLTRERVNLTLDRDIFNSLRELSAETGTPLGRLVDKAIIKTYFPEKELNTETLKTIAKKLVGKKLTHENINNALTEIGFKKLPGINIGGIHKTPEGFWTNIYYSSSNVQVVIDENDNVVGLV